VTWGGFGGQSICSHPTLQFRLSTEIILDSKTPLAQKFVDITQTVIPAPSDGLESRPCPMQS